MKDKCVLRVEVFIILVLANGCTIDRRGMKNQCPLHHRDLSEDVVRIVYGLPAFPKAYADARDKLFPNTNALHYGGCVVSCCSPTQARVHYCPACRDAENAWVKAHP